MKVLTSFFILQRKKIVSLSVPEFQNKTVIIQIMVAWYPNCLNENKF